MQQLQKVKARMLGLRPHLQTTTNPELHAGCPKRAVQRHHDYRRRHSFCAVHRPVIGTILGPTPGADSSPVFGPVLIRPADGAVSLAVDAAFLGPASPVIPGIIPPSPPVQRPV